MQDVSRVALVTGSTTGIGRAIAEEFAASGWQVAVNGRSTKTTEQAAAELTQAGHRVVGIAADVSDPDSVRHMVERTADTLGPIHALVCNAGIPGPRVFAQDVPPEEFLEVLKVNLWGAFLCAKFALPAMIERGEGRIITISGGGAATGRPMRGAVAYASSKAGVEGLTRNLAAEVARFGITVNCIAPGRIETRGFPRREDDAKRSVPFVSVEHTARLAVWLASDEASETNGETIAARAWDEART